jgi:signal transduction histidine kinase
VRLLPKLTLGILAASALPLAIAGVMSARLSERAMRDRVRADSAALAAEAAHAVEGFLRDKRASLAAYTGLAPLASGSPEVLTGVLRLVYRADGDALIVALLGADGNERVGAAYLSTPEDAEKLDRVVVSDAEHDAFLARVPWKEAIATGSAVGAITAGADGEPRVAVAVALGYDVLAADMSLARIGGELGALGSGDRRVELVDAKRRAVAGGPETRRAAAVGALLPGDKDPAGPLPGPSVATVHGTLAAFAPVSGAALGVLVSQPERTAFAEVRAVATRTWYWVGVSALLALIVGGALARDVAKSVRKLVAGTEKIAGGAYEARLDATGGDELADLALAFNKMAAEIGRASDEIKRWNRELEGRVAEKTSELAAAQELMLRSRSLAAMGTLGAGVAHEINNPLTGVLGAAQLLLMELGSDHPARKLLKDIEAQAQRIRAIVANLLRVAQKEVGDELVAIDLNRVVEDALMLVGESELKKEKIELERRLDPLPQLRGNPLLLQEAIIELVTNARRAMPKGGRLTLATSADNGGLASLRVTDTGRGIEPGIIDKIFDPFFTTKDNWTSTGMGLTLVHKIVEEHKGTIRVDSRPGAGATFTMTFPVAQKAHLA